jgi:serine/threonine protein kinase
MGRGALGVVYKAYQPGPNQYVAIKVLHPHLADDEGFVDRFMRAVAAVVARLRHPGIVQSYDIGRERGLAYVVTEFVDGPTLKAEVETRRAKDQLFALPETVRIWAALANAIDYAHSQGVVHGDLKPSNVMFTSEGWLVLTDFGIKRMIGATALCSPAYMAPEQGQGEAWDEPSDIYSLGVILYEMTTGQVPYTVETPMSVVVKHITAPVPAPRRMNPALPEAVERVILKGLAKDPAARYQTAGEMADALRQAVGTAAGHMPPLQ